MQHGIATNKAKAKDLKRKAAAAAAAAAETEAEAAPTRPSLKKQQLQKGVATAKRAFAGEPLRNVVNKEFLVEARASN